MRTLKLDRTQGCGVIEEIFLEAVQAILNRRAFKSRKPSLCSLGSLIPDSDSPLRAPKDAAAAPAVCVAGASGRAVNDLLRLW